MSSLMVFACFVLFGNFYVAHAQDNMGGAGGMRPPESTYQVQPVAPEARGRSSCAEWGPFGVAFVVLGLVIGAMLRGSRRTVSRVVGPQPRSSSGGSQRQPVAERLANLRGLHAAGLITDAEHARREKEILDEV